MNQIFKNVYSWVWFQIPKQSVSSLLYFAYWIFAKALMSSHEDGQCKVKGGLLFIPQIKVITSVVIRFNEVLQHVCRRKQKSIRQWRATRLRRQVQADLHSCTALVHRGWCTGIYQGENSYSMRKYNETSKINSQNTTSSHTKTNLKCWYLGLAYKLQDSCPL